MPTPLRISFARLCRETRTMLDITQAELAAAVGVSRSHVAGIETGRVDPSLDLVWSIADRLGLDLQLISRHPPLALEPRQGDLVQRDAPRTSIGASSDTDGRPRGNSRSSPAAPTVGSTS